MSTLSLALEQPQWKEWGGVALLCAIPGIVWAISVGDIVAYFTHRLPQGQLLYLFSKLSALYAYFFMTLQIIIGAQGARSAYFKYHPRLGMLTTLTVLAHVALFVVAASLRSGHPALDNLIPIFSQGFYKSSVSLGVIAAYGLIVILLATTLRRRWRGAFLWLHRLAFVVGALGWLHSFLIGTETRIPIIMMFYASLLGLAIFYFFRKTTTRLNRSI